MIIFAVGKSVGSCVKRIEKVEQLMSVKRRENWIFERSKSAVSSMINSLNVD